MRAILSSLLSSNLSIRELHEIVDALDDFDFVADLRVALDQTIVSLDGPIREASRPVRGGTVDIDNAYNAIERRRMSRSRLLELIEKTAPRHLGSLSDPNLSRRDVIVKLHMLASSPEWQDFLRVLSPPETPDPYIEGIISRRGGS